MCGPVLSKKETLHKATSLIEGGTSDCIFFFKEWIYFASIQFILIPTHPSPAARKSKIVEYWEKNVRCTKCILSLTGVSHRNVAKRSIKRSRSAVQCESHRRITILRKPSHPANSEIPGRSEKAVGAAVCVWRGTLEVRGIRWGRLKAHTAHSELVPARAHSWPQTFQLNADRCSSVPDLDVSSQGLLYFIFVLGT